MGTRDGTQYAVVQHWHPERGRLGLPLIPETLVVGVFEKVNDARTTAEAQATVAANQHRTKSRRLGQNHWRVGGGLTEETFDFYVEAVDS